MTSGWAEANCDVERFMQRIKKITGIASLEVKPVRSEVQRGIRPHRATEHATTGVILNSRLMLGRELRGKFPEVRGQPKHRDDATRCRDREQKQKMRQYAGKRRHTAVMKI